MPVEDHDSNYGEHDEHTPIFTLRSFKNLAIRQDRLLYIIVISSFFFRTGGLSRPMDKGTVTHFILLSQKHVNRGSTTGTEFLKQKHGRTAKDY